jgi:phosphoglycolate phosphatase
VVHAVGQGAAVEGIIFDKDGTLFDFQATWAVVTGQMLEALAGPDPVLARRLAEAAGYDLDARALLPGSVIVAGTVVESADVLISAMPRDTDRAWVIDTMISLAETAPQVEAVPLLPFFDTLRARGLALGIATNDGESPARVHLQRAGVLGHMDFLAGYDSGHGAKPGPGQLLAFCATTGIPPAAVLMVGDSRHDLAAGRAAGMRTVGVLTGLATAADLAGDATVVLDHIGHLPDWLDTL